MLNGKYKYSNSDEKWFKDDKLHCLDGLNGRYKYIDGTERWYKDDDLHRDDGPAVTWNNEPWETTPRNSTRVIKNGEEWWYLNGVRYDFEEFIKMTSIPDIDKSALVLKYA